MRTQDPMMMENIVTSGDEIHMAATSNSTLMQKSSNTSWSIKHFSKECALLVAVGLWTGCASSSVFKSYPSRVNPIISDVVNGNELDNELFEKGAESSDKALYLMERGRVHQLIGSYPESKVDFETAIASVKEQDEKAVVSVSEAINQAGGVLLNDNAIPYKAAGYERILLRYLQTINYLSAGDLEGGRVEIANADSEQKLVAEKHEKEIEKAKEKAKENEGEAGFGETFRGMTSEVSKQYGGLDEVAGTVKNSFQNGAAYYLSGIVYESLGDVNNSYISYKQALELSPANKILQQDVVRVALRDRRKDDLAEFMPKFGMSFKDIAALSEPKGSGRVVVVYESGFVAQKKEVKIPIPLIDFDDKGIDGVSLLAFPFYDTKDWKPATPLAVSTEKGSGNTELVCNVNTLAVKSLKEQIPAMVVRQTIRFVAKAVATKAASDSVGKLGALGASLALGVTENADQRSWLTLPQSIQIYRINLHAGPQTLKLGNASGTTQSIEVSVKAGKTTFVHVVDTGSSLRIKCANL